MKELEVLLALVICMVIFSTIVSMIIEAIARTFRLRGGLLRSMLRKVFENEIENKLLPGIDLGNLGLPNSRPLDAPLNAAKRLLGSKQNNELSRQFVQQITSSLGARSSMDTLEFLRKLGDSTIGEEIYLKYRKHTELIIDELANKYEEFGQEASSIYKKYTGLLNTIVAIIFAFSLNINVVSLAKEFYDNTALTNKMILNLERYEADAKEQIARINALADKAEETTANENSIAQLHALQDDIKNIKDLGLPLGYSNQTYLDIKSKWAKNGSILFLFFWVLSTFLTGILIGLGAPFWFDIVKRVGAVQKVSSSIMGGSVLSTTQNVKIESPIDANIQRKQEVDAFTQALKARKVTQGTHSKGSPEGFRAVDDIIV